MSNILPKSSHARKTPPPPRRKRWEKETEKESSERKRKDREREFLEFDVTSNARGQLRTGYRQKPSDQRATEIEIGTHEERQTNTQAGKHADRRMDRQTSRQSLVPYSLFQLTLDLAIRNIRLGPLKRQPCVHLPNRSVYTFSPPPLPPPTFPPLLAVKMPVYDPTRNVGL